MCRFLFSVWKPGHLYNIYVYLWQYLCLECGFGMRTKLKKWTSKYLPSGHLILFSQVISDKVSYSFTCSLEKDWY